MTPGRIAAGARPPAGWSSAARRAAAGLAALATALTAVAASMLALAGPASAHPLNEIVQQVYLTPTRSGLDIELEITPGVLVAPGFAALLDPDGDGALSPQETDAHAEAVRAALAVRVDGVPAELERADARYPTMDRLLAGAGTIRLAWRTVLPPDARELQVHDAYDPGAVAKVQTTVLVGADPVPVGPIRRAAANRTITVGLNGASTPGAASPAPTAGAPSGSAMVEALPRPLTSPLAVMALLTACILLGALHALTPGHGKALLAAYLVGDGGTARQAIGLGVVFTITHTAAVLVIGVAVLTAGERFLPDVVLPLMTIAAGLLVLCLGARLARRRWPGRSGAHGHGHGHGHLGRSGLRGVLTMGFSAGLIPCPEALSVMLLAIGLGRAGLGIVMIIAFSVGLAGVLVGLGLLLVNGAPVLSRFTGGMPHRLTGWLPFASALVVTVLGTTMAVTGAAQLAGGI